jgi:hypothetical protein
VQKWNSISDAGRELDISRMSISYALNCKATSAGRELDISRMSISYALNCKATSAGGVYMEIQ